jgi:hypothetical protein
MALPKPYVDCIVKHRDGTKRIARIGHSGGWQLSSYGAVRHQYIWPVADVIEWRELDLSMESEHE